ncbi:extensin, partial [Neisseria sp. P0009.S007]
MHYFTPAKTLPEGTIYLTDLTHVADFSDWLTEFETLLNQNPRFATACTPMRRQVSD